MDSAWPFAVCPFTDGMSRASCPRAHVRRARTRPPCASGCRAAGDRVYRRCIGCGMLGGVQDRSWDSAGALATMITPTTSATIPAACIASSGQASSGSGHRTRCTPSRSPTSGSPAEMAGSDCVQRAGVERALHQPDADRARAYQRVRRPGGEHRADPAATAGSPASAWSARPGCRTPGPRPPRSASPATGPGGGSPACTATSAIAGDHRGGRPVRHRAERQADRLRRPRRRQQRHPGAQHRRAEHLPDWSDALDNRHREDQREDQVRGQQAAPRTPATGSRSTRPRAPGRRSCSRCPPASAAGAAGR